MRTREEWDGPLAGASSWTDSLGQKWWVYNEAGNPLSMVSEYDYYYDDFTRRESLVTWLTDGAWSNSFAYNDRSELTGFNWWASPEPGRSEDVSRRRQYTYDPIGNRSDRTEGAGDVLYYCRNQVNQYRFTDDAPNTCPQPTSPTESFSYDADGNLTADGTFTYVWDAENRLTEVYPTSPSQGSKKLVFTYDYMGRRVRKTVSVYNNSAWQGQSDQLFVYDGWNVVEVLDANASNAILSKYTWGLDMSGQAGTDGTAGIHGAGGISGLLASVETGTTGSPVHWYFYDANGNVGQVLDATNLNNITTVARYEYDPYGNTLAATGTYAAANPFRFSTKWFDTETGLSYYGYRYYNARLGRWMSRDPIEEDGGLNLYAVVKNAAVNLYDPTGLIGGLSTPACRLCCGQAYNKCIENGGSIPDCDHLLRGCHYSCENYGTPGAEALALCSGYVAPSQIPWLLCCGTCRHIPVLDEGPANDLVVVGCTAVSFVAPAGATCKVIMADANALRTYKAGTIGCRLVRIRKWIRYDLPHHGKCAEWDGTIPNCLRKCGELLRK